MAGCGVKLSNNARITLGGDTVARLKSCGINFGFGEVDISSLTDEYDKYCQGSGNATITADFDLDLDDPAQSQLDEYGRKGGQFNDLRVYFDSTTYFACDIITDPQADMFITSWNPSAPGKNETISGSMTIRVNGPLERYPLSP